MDIRNEELKRLREELELMRRNVRDVRDVRDVRQEQKATQTRDDSADERNIEQRQDQRGRSNISVFIYVLFFLPHFL